MITTVIVEKVLILSSFNSNRVYLNSRIKSVVNNLKKFYVKEFLAAIAKRFGSALEVTGIKKEQWMKYQTEAKRAFKSKIKLVNKV